jgi:hypothetical protein
VLAPKQPKSLRSRDASWIYWDDQPRGMWAQDKDELPRKVMRTFASKKTMVSAYFSRRCSRAQVPRSIETKLTQCCPKLRTAATHLHVHNAKPYTTKNPWGTYQPLLSMTSSNSDISGLEIFELILSKSRCARSHQVHIHEPAVPLFIEIRIRSGFRKSIHIQILIQNVLLVGRMLFVLTNEPNSSTHRKSRPTPWR